MVSFRFLSPLRSSHDDVHHAQSLAAMGTSNLAERSYVLQTARGSLVGTEVADTRTNQPVYRRYARIRYALPPVGDRRWRKPKPLPSDWIFSDGNNHPRNYRKFGAICPQVDSASALLNGGDCTETQNDTSEDCLFLNIWVPAGVEGPAGGWPVQFVYYEFRKRDDMIPNRL